MKRLFSALVLGLACVACDGPEVRSTQAAVLADLVSIVVLPTLRSLDEETSALEGACAGLEAEPTAAALDAAQDTWRKARTPWRQADAFRFGPVETLELEGKIDWWPAKPEAIEEVVSGTDPLDDAAIDDLGASAKGFMALEHLLFDPGGGDGAVLDGLAGEGGARRRSLVRLLAADLHENAKTLRDAWEPSGGNFAFEVTGAGAGSRAFSTAKAAVDRIANEVVFATETVAGAKIGKPFGKQSGGTPQPDLEETPRSDNSIADMLDTLRGVQAIYEGRYGAGDGMGLRDLVERRSPELDERARATIRDALEAVEAIPPPFRKAIFEHPAQVDAAWLAVREMKRVLGSDVATALGVTLRFSDNDGD